MRITGSGMICSLGLCLDEVVASVEAGLSRFRSSPHIGSSGEPTVVACLEPELLPPIPRGHGLPAHLSERQTRIFLLGITALAEASATSEPGVGPTPLLAALPTLRPSEVDFSEWFLDACERQLGHELAERPSHIFSHGRAGALMALEHAAQLLEAGHPRVLVLAADSYMDVELLKALDDAGRLLTHSRTGGFIGGEAAVALLLEPGSGDGGLLGVRVYQGPERFDPERPDRPEVLADAVRELVEGSAPIASIWSGMNGERTWAKELGIARIRNPAAFDDEVELHHPADLWGDLGAATGAALVLLASAAGVDAPVLVSTSADTGEVAAALLGSDGGPT